MIEAFNGGDRDRFRAILSEETIGRQYATGTTAEGAGAVVEYVFAWKASSRSRYSFGSISPRSRRPTGTSASPRIDAD
jgi:hypothetical protein